ncbi:hypothetical protein FMUND_12734 [Fusarium mundagurra]|uniref:Uncharacterized protein n=1 Tax=Fusarium mundagurra TaxID=1567541 RepID=A0A8H6D5F4_9HYPO|nr:hypothetical protein FMUND_12734 [Fusarium mundagurra]
MSLSKCDVVVTATCIPITCILAVINISLLIYGYLQRKASPPTSPDSDDIPLSPCLALPEPTPPPNAILPAEPLRVIIGVSGSNETITDYLANRGLGLGVGWDSEYELVKNPQPENKDIDAMIFLCDADERTMEKWRETKKTAVKEGKDPVRDPKWEKEGLILSFSSPIAGTVAAVYEKRRQKDWWRRVASRTKDLKEVFKP